MSINIHIINHELKLMEMGGREEFLLKRAVVILIIPKILPKWIATRWINPSLKRHSICILWLIFIPIGMINTS
jgi:hypothetical protein